jgi:eukaryotic-like serine/threonine-protein kinase
VIGKTIGPYEVISKLGEGGMGVVYRARDARLNRFVALKVLPHSVTGDPERVARFDREARVLASLNHPNIAQVYGFDGAALAMELVEGQTLDEIIGQGAVPLDRALAIARQIAAALEAAHDQGVVHRDLKPANIKVREDGTVKVLDFGLAKALAEDAGPGASDVSNSPTLTARSTQLGMILGTAAYMSPEQAKGRPVDRRADVWAFGAVLFEMLAGRRAFEGDDVSEVLASVLKTEPDWSALPPALPAPVVRLLKRCLEKDPKKRLRDVAEGMLQLDEGLASSATAASTGAASATSAAPRWRRAMPIVATAIVTAAALFAIDRMRVPSPAAPRASIRFLLEPRPPMSLVVSATEQDMAISPNGQSVLYLAAEGRSPASLFVRRIDQVDAVPLRGAEFAAAPFASPDGAWVGFLDRVNLAQLKKVSMQGGPPVALAVARNTIYGAAWMPNDSIVIGVSGGPLCVVPPGGGEPTPVTTLDAGESEHLWPAVVPGTSVVLFTTNVGVRMPAVAGQLAAIDLATRRSVRFQLQGFHPRFVPPGFMVYATTDGSIRAVRFDPKTLTISGTPVPVLEGVSIKGSGAAQFDVSSDGRLIYVTGGSFIGATRSLTWTDRDGKETPIAAPVRSYFYARLSPDGARVSLDVREQEQNVWVWDLKRDSIMKLTDKPGQFQYCLWTPDGQRVVFASLGPKSELVQMRADGTGAIDQITDAASRKLTPYPNAITPDGQQVIFRALLAGSTNSDLYIASLSGDHAMKPLLATEHDERNAALSPDGKWMAFESDLSDHFEVYVRPFPNVEAGQFQISTNGGVKPLWSPTGREIFYVSNDNRMMAVPVDTARGFSAGKPTVLFDGSSYFLGAVGRNFDVTPDGKRFVMIKNSPEAKGPAAVLTVVIDWAEELRARLK